MQQSRYNDIQLLQHHLMLKQMQELQRQQQLPQLCNVRQQSTINYPFAATKQAADDIPQFLLNNGTYVTDTSQFLANWENRGVPAFVQGLSDHLSPSTNQCQPMHSSDLLPQGVSASIYGSNAPESYSFHLQGISPETASLANKLIDHQQTLSIMEPSALGTSLMRDQFSVTPGQVWVSEGMYICEQDYANQNMYGEVLPQSQSSGLHPETLRSDNIMQTGTQFLEFGWKQDQADWPGNMHQKQPQMVPLDPLEKKILYNSDDSVWDASFGKYSDIVPGGIGNTFEPMDSFPSINSGSWSALMQSAVAETSSGDTGLTEEWSGLTHQNPENSTDNQPSVMDSGKQHVGWVENNLQSPLSLTSSPIMAFNNSGKSPSIPVFQPSGVQSSSHRHSVLPQDVSHGIPQKPADNAIDWLDSYSMKNPSLQWSRQLQPISQLNAWSSQNYEHAGGDKDQQIIPTNDCRRLLSQEKGENEGAPCQFPNASNSLVNENINSVYVVDNSRLTGELDQLQSEVSIFASSNEDLKVNNSMGIQNSYSQRSQQEANQHKQSLDQSNKISQVDIPMYIKETATTERNPDQIMSAGLVHHSLYFTNQIYPLEDVKGKLSASENGQLHASDIGTNLVKESASSGGGNLNEPDGIASVIYPQCDKTFPFDSAASSHTANITALGREAEKEWAQATQRLIEKLEGELENILDKRPRMQARRRILLSTQLLQQLLRAPPAPTFSVDATSTYDSLTYFVAKVTIGDACSLTDCHNSDAGVPSSGSNRIPEKVKTFDLNADSYFSEAMEDLMGRTKKLEDVLKRVEKAGLILDIHVENQDLERYSVINRLAKYHTPGPTNSSSISAPTVPRDALQKQVRANPVPETPPEGIWQKLDITTTKGGSLKAEWREYI
ncbi:hypothetical protein SAY86_014667 [Trapa natans]|uniref:Uncharacterized protein n=1 Tax=Trapa natans TaxID=22666 RepID=A0AAN7KGX4_TRANT|nr:hypothetical protein SAY86_014667 [Trapa natans]